MEIEVEQVKLVILADEMVMDATLKGMAVYVEMEAAVMA